MIFRLSCKSNTPVKGRGSKTFKSRANIKLDGKLSFKKYNYYFLFY